MKRGQICQIEGCKNKAVRRIVSLNLWVCDRDSDRICIEGKKVGKIKKDWKGLK